MQKKNDTSQGGVAEAELLMNGQGPQDPASPLHRLAQAVSLHLRGEREAALRALEGADRNGESSEPAEINAARGHIQFELGRFEEAAASYERLAELKADDPEIHFNLGLCFQN